MAEHLTPTSQTQKTLKLSVVDGAMYSFMVGVGETFLPAFVLALGLGEVTAGLIAVLPMVVGALLQLISPWAVQSLKSHKKWVVACASIQALAFLPLILLAVYKKDSLIILFFATVLYWAGGLGTTAAWNSWMARVVPADIRTRYFARRGRIAHLGVLIGLIVGSQIAQQGKISDSVLSAFALMFLIGMIARLISTYSMSQQHEPPGAIESQDFIHPLVILKDLALKKEGKILKYLLFTQMFVHISAPYFAPFMLKQLELDYQQYMVLVCTSFLARALVLPLVGRRAHQFSATKLLKLGGALIIPMPAIWIFSEDFLFLIFAQFVGGASWAIFELGMTLSFFEGIEERKRTSILTCFSFANAIAMTTGSIIGGLLLSILPKLEFFSESTLKHSYYVLFALSALGRLMSLFFLRGLPDIRTGVRIIASKILAVRPTMGAVDKPVTSTIEHKKH